MRPEPTRRATDAKRAYRFAFIGIAIVMLVLSALLSTLVTAHRDDARYVDLSGLERMRTQRIAFLAERLARPGARLQAERDELIATAGAFRDGAPLVVPAGASMIEVDIARYVAAADRIARGASDRQLALATILEFRLPLLAAIDAAVHRRAAENAGSLDRLVLTIFAVLVLQFGAAWLAWRFVIVPFEARERFGAARLRALFEGNPEAVATYGLDGTITSGNAASLELVGHSAGELVGSHFAKHIAADALPATSAAFERAIAGEAVQFETVFVRSDGGRRTVLVNLFPNMIDTRILGVYAIGRDVTALTQARAALAASERNFRSLFEQNPDAVAIIDATGNYVGVNAAAERMTGLSAAEFVGKNLGSLGLDDPAAVKLPPDAMRRLQSGEAVDYEFAMTDRSGRDLEIFGKAVPIADGGENRGFFSIARDVTEERRARREIVENAKRIAELYLVAASSGRSTDEQIASALELGRTRLGFHRAYLVRVQDDLATVLLTVGSDVLAAGSTLPLGQTMLRHSLASGDLHMIDDTESERWRDDPAMAVQTMRSSVTIPITVDGRIDGALAFASDVPRRSALTQDERDFVRLIAALVGSTVERGRQRTKLDALAFFDSLTGLPNRVLLDDRINELLVAAKRYGRRFAVLFIDLDGFKNVNDRSGHGAGDDVLRVVGERITRIVGANDTVARLGGDEFVVLVRDNESDAEAETLAVRIIATLGEPFRIGNETHTIGASVGIAIAPDHGNSAPTLLDRADRALYRAKRNGRGTYALHVEMIPQRIVT